MCSIPDGSMRIAAICAAGLLLGACSTSDEPVADAPDKLSTESRGEGESMQSADRIAQRTLSAPTGSSFSLSADNGQQVFVTVGSRYTSAAGTECYRITLRTQRDASRVSAVCQNDGVWSTVLTP